MARLYQKKKKKNRIEHAYPLSRHRIRKKSAIISIANHYFCCFMGVLLQGLTVSRKFENVLASAA